MAPNCNRCNRFILRNIDLLKNQSLATILKINVLNGHVIDVIDLYTLFKKKCKLYIYRE